ncbi:MAG: hypothetical protein EOO89_06025 [Pedobacter sp.]|nr:MAG: hypothetical protein EOO89_06025 [Pedobacter sp.]
MKGRLAVPLIVAVLCCFSISGKAQHTFELKNGPVMAKFEDSLVKISDGMYNAESTGDRFAKNAAFIKTLVNSLKTHTSFNYPFDSLKRVSIVKSPDNTFRIISWFVPLDDGSYRFFGTVQMATKDGKLKLFPLIDNTDNISDNNYIGNNKNWYGARYYEIIPVIVGGRPPYYILMGWKGNNSKTTKKVLDVLSFEKEELTFGKPVFDGLKGSVAKNRIVFEYNKLNSMTLTLDKTVNMIVFDHLAPFSEDMKGNFEYYASDLSFDAYKIQNGRLKLLENIELKNDPNNMDELYVDPKDTKTKAIKKL